MNKIGAEMEKSNVGENVSATGDLVGAPTK